MADIQKGDKVWLRLGGQVAGLRVEKIDGTVLTGTQPNPFPDDPPVVIDLAEGWAVEHVDRG